VPLRALPRRHQMQHVHALVRLAVLLARLARELDAARREEGAACGGVDHLDEALFFACVKINFFGILKISTRNA